LQDGKIMAGDGKFGLIMDQVDIQVIITCVHDQEWFVEHMFTTTEVIEQEQY
jgi:hypothetical protein